jgi:cytochrome c biogenesis protein CcmG/thiol:disulfide interchange protein DsbE
MPSRLFVLVLVVVCLVPGCRDSDTSSQSEEGHAAQTSAAGPSPPGRAEAALLPDLMLPDLTGRLRPLRATPKAVTLLNFWATWCVPCLKELPELVAVHHRWQVHGVDVVGIAIDSGAPADIRAFADQHRLEYRLLIGTSQWARTHFQLFGLPVTVVVDRHGQIRQRLIGPHTEEQFAAAIQPYLR